MKTTVFILALMVPAAAQAADGNKLHRYCNAESGSYGQSFCNGYIDAVADMIEVQEILGFDACWSGNVTNGQLFDIVKSFLASNPDLRHYKATGLVANAFSDAFPC